MFPHQWTSYRLRTQTLYFNSQNEKYELKRYLSNHIKYQKGKNYCLSKIKPELSSDHTNSIPYMDNEVVIIHDQFSWYDVIWSFDSVLICNKRYYITSLFFSENTVRSIDYSILCYNTLLNLLVI